MKKNWSREEELLLVDLFQKVYLEGHDLNVLSELLSELLRNMAIQAGEMIDFKYRNVSGIKMKYQNLLFVFTDGKEGLSKCSNMDKEIMNYYKNDKSNFERELQQIKRIYKMN